MKKRTFLFMSCFFFVILLPTVGLSVSSFIVAFENMNTQCDDKGDDIIRLSTWLFINSGSALWIITIYISLFVLFMICEQYKFLIMCSIIYVLNWLFVIGWNVVGAIQLFKHSEDCRLQAESLWIMVLIALIFQWVGIFLTCCLGGYDRSKIVEIGEDINMEHEEGLIN
jgi:hypothetical protein